MKIHVVQLGDTLSKISKKHGVDLEALKKMNKQLTSPDSLKPGMKVKVPTGGKPVKKKMAAKEKPKYKKEAPKMSKKPAGKKTEKMESKKPMKEKPFEGNPMNEQPAGEPPRPNPMNDHSQEESVPGEGWAHHYPLNGLPNNWQEGEEPQVSGAHADTNANPMMHPQQVSPAHYGPNANPMMHPHQVSPAHYGPNANPMMHPQQVSPAHYGPNANPMMGSPCGCNKGPQGPMPMHQGPMWGEPFAPPMPEMDGRPWEGYDSPQMQGDFQPEYWEPNNDDSFYGMFPASEEGYRNGSSNDDDTNQDG
ncbi:MAG TPA: LysM peptidoglycan-binding domain-containing protein [Bacillales bacterium]|nr:LysM peptidoglycan-binding domain-containing protein [Bacillales bacterium]